jgi:hypothetical protein
MTSWAYLACLGVLVGGILTSGCQPERPPQPPSAPAAAVTDTTNAARPDTTMADADYLRTTVGQTLYVPVYGHIYYSHGDRAVNLTVTLSIRNTDPDLAIRVTAVDYHETDGTLVQRYLDAPRRLGPLATTEIVIDEHDNRGGSGANFIVEWDAAQPVTPPLVESVMISTASAQGLSFNIPARVIRERSP